jgi:hypothetical protein
MIGMFCIDFAIVVYLPGGLGPRRPHHTLIPRTNHILHLHRGAALAYRIVLYHPDLVTHLFTVCVPYIPPNPKYISLEDMVRTLLPNFSYQLQFKSGEIEKVVKTKKDIKQFLLALYGGRTEDGQLGFSTDDGVLFDKQGKLGPSRLLSEEVCIAYGTLLGVWLLMWLMVQELDYYVDEFSQNGIHGPCEYPSCRIPKNSPFSLTESLPLV